MTKLYTSTNKFGALVKKELWREDNWCRKDVPVTVTNADQVGLVVYNDGGTFVALTETKMAAWVAGTDELAVLVDERVETLATDVASDVELAVMYRGNAILSKAPVTTSVGDPVIASLDAMYAEFDANLMEFAEYLTTKTVSKV